LLPVIPFADVATRTVFVAWLDLVELALGREARVAAPAVGLEAAQTIPVKITALASKTR
jgi:hypothetical protein